MNKNVVTLKHACASLTMPWREYWDPGFVTIRDKTMFRGTFQIIMPDGSTYEFADGGLIDPLPECVISNNIMFSTATPADEKLNMKWQQIAVEAWEAGERVNIPEGSSPAEVTRIQRLATAQAAVLGAIHHGFMTKADAG